MGVTPTQGEPELKAELKLLNWHKLANDAALKAALMKTKQLKQDDKPQQEQYLRKQAEWMQRVIEEEQAKPLHVSKEFMMNYQKREKLEEDRLDKQVERHILSLKKLRAQIDKRQQTQWKRDQLKRGKAAIARAPKKPETDDDDELLDLELKRAQQDLPTKQQKSSLTTVLSSLDRLVDLERRIASLEKDSIYDRVEHAAAEPTKPPHQQKKRKRGLKFTKQRIPLAANRPAKDVYAVRLADRSRAPQTKRPQRGATSDVLSAGETNRRGTVGHRQDQAIHQWLQRKQKQRSAFTTTKPKYGASCGRRGKNPAQQKFLDMKTNVEKRKDAMRSRLHQPPKRRIRPTGTTTTTTKTTRMPPIPRSMPPKKKRSTASETSSLKGSSKGRRGPLPKTTTTTTKKKHEPLPHIAGSGVVGIRTTRPRGTF